MDSDENIRIELNRNAFANDQKKLTSIQRFGKKHMGANLSVSTLLSRDSTLACCNLRWIGAF